MSEIACYLRAFQYLSVVSCASVCFLGSCNVDEVVIFEIACD